MTNHADLLPETLRRYLSDLAHLGARFGIELRPDIRHGSMRITPITPEHGGYYVHRAAGGPLILLPYDSGCAHDDTTDVVGDDMHPAAQAERARRWQAENAEALADERRAAQTGDPFPAAFRSGRDTVDPGLDLD